MCNYDGSMKAILKCIKKLVRVCNRIDGRCNNYYGEVGHGLRIHINKFDT